jgi:hypothetical protein
LILCLSGYTPLNFVKYLDHCAKLILLKKVGVGDLANQFNSLPCQADFTYTIMPGTFKIQDTGKGKKSVPDDLEAVLRKIEYWHQGSIARSRISYVSTQGTEHLIDWDGRWPEFLSNTYLDETSRGCQLCFH